MEIDQRSTNEPRGMGRERRTRRRAEKERGEAKKIRSSPPPPFDTSICKHKRTDTRTATYLCLTNRPNKA